MPPIQISAEAARSADVPTPLLPVRPNSVSALNNSQTTPPQTRHDHKASEPEEATSLYGVVPISAGSAEAGLSCGSTALRKAAVDCHRSPFDMPRLRSRLPLCAMQRFVEVLVRPISRE
jgi:hypothetical protein